MITKTLIVQQLPEQGQLTPKTYYAVQKGEKFVLHLTDSQGVVKEMQVLDTTQLNDLAKITQMESDITQLKERQDKYITDVKAVKEGNNVVFTYSFSSGEPVIVTVEDKDTLPTVYDDSEVKNRLNSLEVKNGEQDGKIQILQSAKDTIESELATKSSKEELNSIKQDLENKIHEKLSITEFNSIKASLESRIQALENASNESIGTWV